MQWKSVNFGVKSRKHITNLNEFRYVFAYSLANHRIEWIKRLPFIEKFLLFSDRIKPSFPLWKFKIQIFLIHNPLSSKTFQVSYFWRSTWFHSTFFISDTSPSLLLYLWLLPKSIRRFLACFLLYCNWYKTINCEKVKQYADSEKKVTQRRSRQ